MNKKKTGEKISNGLLVAGMALALLAIVLGSQQAEAAGEATGNVSLVATIKDGPAMRAVAWAVLRDGRVVETTRSHSITLSLSSGTYTAELSCDGKSRKDRFTVSSNSRIQVVMACD